MPHKKQRVFKGYAVKTTDGYQLYRRNNAIQYPVPEIPKGFYLTSINENQMTTLIALLGYKDAYASLVNLCV